MKTKTHLLLNSTLLLSFLSPAFLLSSINKSINETPINQPQFATFAEDNNLKNQLSKKIKKLKNDHLILEKETKKLEAIFAQAEIDKKQELNELTLKVKAQITNIVEGNEYLNSILSNLNVQFNKAYFYKFIKDFEQEKQLIVKPFEEIGQDMESSKMIKWMESELFKLSYHSLTIENFLQNAYNSLLNKNVFNPLDDWELVRLDDETYKYYQSILNKKGQELITSLQTLISDTMVPEFPVSKKSHLKKNYDNIWELFKRKGFKDLERGKEQYILDIYSKNPLGPDQFNFTEKDQPKNTKKGDKKVLGSEYQREHLIPQSSFRQKDKNQKLLEAPMYFDVHHIFPVDGITNLIRSNNDHGIVKKPILTVATKMANDSKIGFDENGRKVFEPVDAFKGDIARSYLYFAIRYHRQFPTFNSNTVFTSSFPYMKSQNLKDMLNWHENVDVVDTYDLERNKEIFKYQKNRNPFIDIPYLSKFIWNEKYQDKELVFLKK